MLLTPLIRSSWLVAAAITNAKAQLTSPHQLHPPPTSDELDALKGLKLYCHMLGMPNANCEAKFTGLVLDDSGSASDSGRFITGEHQVDSLVSRKAAETCLTEANLQHTAMSKMFGVGMKDMAQYAAGGGGTAIRDGAGMAQEPKPDGGADRYSDEIKEKAWQQAYNRKFEELKIIREIENASQISKLIPKAGTMSDHMEDAASRLGVDLYYEISARSAAAHARENPWEQGFQPDKPAPNTPGSSGSGASGPGSGRSGESGESGTGGGGEGSSGHGKDDHGPDFNPTTDKDMEALPDDKSKGSGDTPQESAPMLLIDDPAVNVDTEIATPVYDDLNTKTALQQCQEKQEKKLWEVIGTEHRAPNAESDEQGRKDWAEELLGKGICDQSYYDRAACQDFKNKQWNVPLPPDMEADLLRWHDESPICPTNVAHETECHLAKQEVLKRYAVTPAGERIIDIALKPGKPVSWLPPLDRNPVLAAGGSGLPGGAGPDLAGAGSGLGVPARPFELRTARRIRPGGRVAGSLPETLGVATERSEGHSLPNPLPVLFVARPLPSPSPRHIEL